MMFFSSFVDKETITYFFVYFHSLATQARFKRSALLFVIFACLGGNPSNTSTFNEQKWKSLKLWKSDVKGMFCRNEGAPSCCYYLHCGNFDYPVVPDTANDVENAKDYTERWTKRQKGAKMRTREYNSSEKGELKVATELSILHTDSNVKSYCRG